MPLVHVPQLLFGEPHKGRPRTHLDLAGGAVVRRVEPRAVGLQAGAVRRVDGVAACVAGQAELGVGVHPLAVRVAGVELEVQRRAARRHAHLDVVHMALVCAPATQFKGGERHRPGERHGHPQQTSHAASVALAKEAGLGLMVVGSRHWAPMVSLPSL